MFLSSSSPEAREKYVLTLHRALQVQVSAWPSQPDQCQKAHRFPILHYTTLPSLIRRCLCVMSHLLCSSFPSFLSSPPTVFPLTSHAAPQIIPAPPPGPHHDLSPPRRLPPHHAYRQGRRHLWRHLLPVHCGSQSDHFRAGRFWDRAACRPRGGGEPQR